MLSQGSDRWYTGASLVTRHRYTREVRDFGDFSVSFQNTRIIFLRRAAKTVARLLDSIVIFFSRPEHVSLLPRDRAYVRIRKQ